MLVLKVLVGISPNLKRSKQLMAHPSKVVAALWVRMDYGKRKRETHHLHRNDTDCCRAGVRTVISQTECVFGFSHTGLSISMPCLHSIRSRMPPNNNPSSHPQRGVTTSCEKSGPQVWRTNRCRPEERERTACILQGIIATWMKDKTEASTSVSDRVHYSS